LEPALDDINLRRFIGLIEGFARDAQVLVVTHQKRTMEVAGMMYGVSMSKEGTSKVLAQRIDTPAASGSAGEAGGTVVVPAPDAVR
jgi:chromosome segregation protein